MKYIRRTKVELVAFAANRGVQVPSGHADPRKGLTSRDYIHALKQADERVTFRFMDLPTELRTRVYEDLLILKDSYTCFPQILCTSRQIHEEAPNILYGENLIDLKISSDGVFVRSMWCGRYASTRFNCSQSLSKMYWPSLLRRAQYLRISILQDYRPREQAQSASYYLAKLSHAIYSLSRTLQNDNRLRSCEVSLDQCLASHLPKLRSIFEAFCYPLRLLSHRTICKATYSGTTEPDGFDVTSLDASNLLHATSSQIMKVLCHSIDVVSKIIASS